MAYGKQKQTNPKLATFSVSAGAVAGAVATSGTAVSAAGAGAAGFSGYVVGLVALATNVGCETWAAVGLGTVAAGPILGALIGYSLYRGVKSIARRSRKPAEGS
ncbi:MAG: hypothetical protein ABSG75_14635 [Syntrophales bacterium]|jgi:hypothetical protein